MLVTTATVGESFRKAPSLSSASATRNSPMPSFALEPRLFSFPPTPAVGPPGDRDAVLPPPPPREHLGALDHGDLPAVPLENLGIPGSDRRGYDHHVTVRRDVRSRVTRPHHRSQPLEPFGRVGAPQGGPRTPTHPVTGVTA